MMSVAKTTKAVAVHFKGTGTCGFYPSATRVEVLAMNLDGEKALVVPMTRTEPNARPRWVTTERLGKIRLEENV